MVFGITQPPTTFIWYTNVEKFSYDSYLAISAFNLLSYVVGVDAQLGKHGDFFRLRWDILGIPPPYDGRSTTITRWYDGVHDRRSLYNDNTMRQGSRTMQTMEYTVDYNADNGAYHWLYDRVYDGVHDRTDEAIVSLPLYSIRSFYDGRFTTVALRR